MNKLLELSKQAKKSKDYELERSYLKRALSKSPNNIKIINALIRNRRKVGDVLELKHWLNVLYELKPNGKILFELMHIEQHEGNYEKVRDILMENRRIDPNSKKIQKRIEKNEEKIKERKEKKNIMVHDTSFFSVTEEEAKLINTARDIIYSDAIFSSKYNQIANMLASFSEEIILSVFAELYVVESSTPLAQNLVKKYKKGLNPETDIRKLKLANRLLELVSNRKTKRFNWDDFWRAHLIILSGEKKSPKVLVKNDKNNKIYKAG